VITEQEWDQRRAAGAGRLEFAGMSTSNGVGPGRIEAVAAAQFHEVAAGQQNAIDYLHAEWTNKATGLVWSAGASVDGSAGAG
jgi:hypothetical protein